MEVASLSLRTIIVASKSKLAIDLIKCWPPLPCAPKTIKILNGDMIICSIEES